MRRTVFQSENYSEIDGIAQRSEVGYLGLNDPEGYPRIVPLNFIYFDKQVYFHGADDGEKFTIFSSNPKVTFGIVEPYSLIPSYWLVEEYACPATALYKSVHIRGEGSVVDNLSEKADMLQMFMEKYQPEGNYKPITAEDPLYIKPLEGVSVFKIKPSQVDFKSKFGQNFGEDKRRTLIKKLEERNREIDIRTAAEIRKTFDNGNE